jgi:hypothetical protein
MIEFVAALILGTVLGVIADRLWSWVERTPRLDIIGGEFMTRNEEGYQFTITNRGAFEIPPYKIYVYHPSHGSGSFFTRDKEGGQLPNQKIMHNYIMFKNGRMQNEFIDFYRDGNNNPMNEAQKNGFIFRLVLDNSDKIIYENKNTGNTFVKIFQNARENKSIRGIVLMI